MGASKPRDRSKKPPAAFDPPSRDTAIRYAIVAMRYRRTPLRRAPAEHPEAEDATPWSRESAPPARALPFRALCRSEPVLARLPVYYLVGACASFGGSKVIIATFSGGTDPNANGKGPRFAA